MGKDTAEVRLSSMLDLNHDQMMKTPSPKQLSSAEEAAATDECEVKIEAKEPITQEKSPETILE